MADEQDGGGPKPSAVEVAKTASNYLRGDIAKELVDGAPGFGKGSIQLLKNHGTYQQDDRETRKAVDGKKSERQISFMIRTCVPGGKLTAEQLLSAIDMGDELGNGTIRLTTRQSIQPTTPGRIGEPVPDGFQSIPANLPSSPSTGSLANRQQRSS